MVSTTTALGVGGTITATTGTTDTLSMTNADAVALTVAAVGATFKAAVTGFETLDAGTATATTISMTAFGSFNEFVVIPATLTQVLSGMTSGKTLTLNTTAAAFTSLTTNNLSGAEDTMTIKLKGALSTALVAYGTVTNPGVENLTITTVDSVTTHAATLSTLTVVDAEARSIVITGNNGLALTFAGVALNTFDASGLTKGAVTFTSGVQTTDVVVKGSVAGGDTLNFASATSKITMTATAGTNLLTGGTLAGTITGGTGADTITGGAAADVLSGGAGADRILAGTGNDTLTGGGDVDTFVMSGTVANLFTNSLATTAGIDRITDFISGTDKIAIVNTGTGVTSVVLTTVTVATAADVATLLTAIGTSVALSAGAVQQVGVITVSAGAMAGTYLLFNDTANAAAALDTLVNITGAPTVVAADFTFA
jgi:S-layer protein